MESRTVSIVYLRVIYQPTKPCLLYFNHLFLTPPNTNINLPYSNAQQISLIIPNHTTTSIPLLQTLYFKSSNGGVSLPASSTWRIRFCFPNLHPAFAHFTPNARPGCTAVIKAVASTIIAPSKTINVTSSFASLLVNPFDSSATRKTDLVRMRTVASAIPITKPPISKPYLPKKETNRTK